MPDLKDEAQAADEVGITKTPDTNGPVWAKVKVTAESGLFKNGHHYEKGEIAHFSLSAARQFAALGDCEIIEESVPVKVESDTDELGRTVNEKVVLDD